MMAIFFPLGKHLNISWKLRGVLFVQTLLPALLSSGSKHNKLFFKPYQ